MLTLSCDGRPTEYERSCHNRCMRDAKKKKKKRREERRKG
jgi:hypothetical protein